MSLCDVFGSLRSRWWLGVNGCTLVASRSELFIYVNSMLYARWALLLCWVVMLGGQRRELNLWGIFW